MDKIYYNELLNHKAIDRMYKTKEIRLRICSLIWVIFYILGLVSSIFFIWMFTLILICAFIISIRKIEKKKIQKLVTYYNDCIRDYNFLEVDDDLKNGFIGISKDVLLNKLEFLCEPEFVYDDETKVYTAQNIQTIIVNGYFKDTSVSRIPKRNYIMVFNDCEYYMCCIDNLICWEKGTYWSKFYKEKALKNAKIDFTKW